MGLGATKPSCLQGFANNKGTEQPAHPRRLISAFVIYHISTCFKRRFNFLQVSVAEETGLSLALSETLKTGFVATRPFRFLKKYSSASVCILDFALIFSDSCVSKISLCGQSSYLPMSSSNI